MCAECEADEGEPLREVYLARRARIAQTWTPPGRSRRQWVAVSAETATRAAAEPMPVAAE
jgi:hypothetical protein